MNTYEAYAESCNHDLDNHGKCCHCGEWVLDDGTLVKDL